MKKNFKIILYCLSGLSIVALISLDLMSVRQTTVSYPVYRLLSDLDKTVTPPVPTTVSIIGSDHDELTNKTALTNALTYEQIEGMVYMALDKQGSANNLFKPGKKILIKPNIVGATANGTGENTDTRVIKALVKYIHAKTGGDVTIKIGEATPRMMPYETKFTNGSASWSELWDRVGYPELLDELKDLGINVDTVNLNGGATSVAERLKNLTEVPVPNGGYAVPQNGKYYIHNEILNADVYITVPVLKVHNPGITNALKNQIGIAPGNRYGFNKTKGVIADGNAFKLTHNTGTRDWTDEEIVDLSLLAGIDLVVVDATLCLQEKKSASGSNAIRLNTVVVGNDPVAVDKVCAEIAGFNPDDVNHINLAEMAGMGTKNPDYITLTGSDPLHVTKPMKKDVSDARLMWGEGCRTWLVSPKFDIGTVSNPIDHGFITNEATYQAKPGENGWSHPIYFLDDRIDLGNYYSYPSNYVSYTFTHVYSPTEKDAELWIGSDEDLKVYLNGTVVYTYSGTRSYTLLSEVRTIHLLAGNNILMVKSIQQTGEHDFTLNICEPNSTQAYKGHRVSGLKFIPELKPTDTEDQTERNISTLSCTPNPASTQLVISCQDASSEISIRITDLQGRLIRRLNSAPRHTVVWNLDNESGQRVKPGYYIITDLSSNSSEKVVVTY